MDIHHNTQLYDPTLMALHSVFPKTTKTQFSPWVPQKSPQPELPVPQLSPRPVSKLDWWRQIPLTSPLPLVLWTVLASDTPRLSKAICASTIPTAIHSTQQQHPTAANNHQQQQTTEAASSVSHQLTRPRSLICSPRSANSIRVVTQLFTVESPVNCRTHSNHWLLGKKKKNHSQSVPKERKQAPFLEFRFERKREIFHIKFHS